MALAFSCFASCPTLHFLGSMPFSALTGEMDLEISLKVWIVDGRNWAVVIFNTDRIEQILVGMLNRFGVNHVHPTRGIGLTVKTTR